MHLPPLRKQQSGQPSTSGPAHDDPLRSAPPEGDAAIWREVGVPGHFEEINVGQVVSLGVAAVDAKGLEGFRAAFAPSWDAEAGAPDALVFAIWSKLDTEASANWPQSRRLGVDALRWMRNPPAGELLRGRMTVLAKDPVGDDKGVVIAQHDLLDEAGRLVFSCLTRSVFRCRG